MKKKIPWRFAIIPLITLTALRLIGPLEITAQEQAYCPVPPATAFCSKTSEISPNECNALAALYEETGGNGWVDNAGWLKHANPCDWLGVTCSDKHVTKLMLHSNNLTGNIPPTLGVLTHLEELDLSENRLSGAIPPQLGLLTNLKYLYLSKNRLAGAIPSELGNLTNLASLNLPGNRLTGELPPEFGKLTRLRRLDLSVNGLSGTLPPEIGFLTNLETLYLWANQFSGTVPSEMGKLHNLTSMRINFNGLETNDPGTRKFLISREPDWENSQTKAPEDVKASWMGDKLKLTWKPINDTEDSGDYVISYGSAPEGPYLVHGKTTNKKTMEYIIENVNGESVDRYYYVLQSHTPPHGLKGVWGKQKNDLFSHYSPPVALPGTHYLSVKTLSPGQGKVTGGGNYPEDTHVILTASTDHGGSFIKWGGDASGSENPLTVMVDEPKEITAEFGITILTKSAPEKGGAVTGKKTCKYGSQVTFKAVPNPGYFFLKWSGDVSDTANPLILTVDDSKDITAEFGIIMRTRSAPKTGGIIKGGEKYKLGSKATLRAIPNPGYFFLKWSGDVSGKANPLTLTADESKNITAEFRINTLHVTTWTTPEGGGVIKGSGKYKSGSRATLRAIPNPGYFFLKWSGDVLSKTNPLTIKMNQSKNITAHFAVSIR